MMLYFACMFILIPLGLFAADGLPMESADNLLEYCSKVQLSIHNLSELTASLSAHAGRLRENTTPFIDQAGDIVELVQDALDRIPDGVDEQVTENLFAADTAYGLLRRSLEYVEQIAFEIKELQRRYAAEHESHDDDKESSDVGDVIIEIVRIAQEINVALRRLMVQTILFIQSSEDIDIIDRDGVGGLVESVLPEWR